MPDSSLLKTQPSCPPRRLCVKPVVLSGTSLWEATRTSPLTSAMDADCRSRLGATMMTALQVTCDPFACEQPMSTSLTTLTSHLPCMSIAESRERHPHIVVLDVSSSTYTHLSGHFAGRGKNQKLIMIDFFFSITTKEAVVWPFRTNAVTWCIATCSMPRLACVQPPPQACFTPFAPRRFW